MTKHKSNQMAGDLTMMDKIKKIKQIEGNLIKKLFIEIRKN
jgi:hypothetical protein